MVSIVGHNGRPGVRRSRPNTGHRGGNSNNIGRPIFASGLQWAVIHVRIEHAAKATVRTAIAKVTEALKTEGFGVDVKATLG